MTFTWKDVGDRPDKKLSQSEKEVIAAEWNRYEKEEKPASDLENLRLQRNNLLSQSDWMSLPDAPTMSDAWKKYRQELRDITKTYKSPDNVKWPTKPE